MAMKLMTIVGAATAAVASSSSTSSSSSSIAVESRSLALGNTNITPRQLQDANGNTYSYLDDLTGYALEYSNCVRVKIPRDNDDDEVDGNVNFYNGRYHAQYQIFATFHVCGDGNYNGGGNQCSSGGTCDYGTEYAMEVGEYLESTMDHWEGYCEACMGACNGRVRRLEEDGDANNEVDCNSCSTPCTNYYQGGDDADDESAYVDCQEGDVDEDGMQVYYGPQCSDDGQIIIGVFYDDECTIKTKSTLSNFDYYKFGTILSGCIDCSDEDGAEACADLYGDAYHCYNGNDQTGKDDEMSACRSVKKAMTSIDYSGVHGRHSGADAFLKVFFVVLACSVAGGFFFLTYTYFIRHRGEKSQPMLSSEDVHEEMGEPHISGGTLT